LWIIISGYAADWATEESWFESWQEKKFSLFEENPDRLSHQPRLLIHVLHSAFSGWGGGMGS